MVCEENGTFLDITIPVVMLPKDAGSRLEAEVVAGNRGMWLSPVFLLTFSLSGL